MSVTTGIDAPFLMLASGLRDHPSFWMPEQASTLAPTVDLVYDVITWISYVFFFAIVGFMFYFMWKYRQKGRVVDSGGPTHNTPLEVTWSVIPLILVIAIFYIGMKGYIHIQTPPGGSYEVFVTAQKWTWQFQHRNGATDTELDVPAGRPVKLIMGSQDVLHALFIPAFRVKQDVVPGRYRVIWFEVPDTKDEIRHYDLFCAEYCGTDHSRMITTVNVVPADQWDDYITEKANMIDKLPEDMYACYAAQRLYPRCSSCHSLDGATRTGPTFQGLWDRIVTGEDVVFKDGSTLAEHYASGRFSGPEDFVRDSIMNPQSLVRETFPASMPTFQGLLKESEIIAMIRFLQDPYVVVDDQGKLLDPAACDLAAAIQNAAEETPAPE